MSPHVELTEPELLARARGGDEGAGEDLFQHYRRRVMGIIFQHYRIRGADAEDIFQCVHIRFFKHIRTVRRPRAFLAAVTTTACLQHWRNRNTERRAMQELAVRHAPPQDGLRRQEQRLIDRLDVQDALGKISARCAEIIRAVVLRQIPQSEYARETATPLGTVASTVARCLRKIRAALVPSASTHEKRNDS